MEDGGSTVRVGVIGRGFGERVIAPAFAGTEGCSVVDVVSPREPEAVAELCSRRDVDLISVHSPPFLHLDNVRRAIDGGHAVLCDKPFGRDAEDAALMHDLARDAGVVNLVNFEFRYHPTRMALRELMLDGTVGAVEHVQWAAYGSFWREPLRPFGWLFDAELGGGWVRAWGSHIVDFLRWSLGEVEDASAILSTAIGERPDSSGVVRRCSADDGFVATMRLVGGASVTLDSTSAGAVEMPSTITVLGSEGVLELVSSTMHELDTRITLRTAAGSSEKLSFAQSGDNHRSQMEDWGMAVRDAVRTGAAGRGMPTFADGLACARVLDALTNRGSALVNGRSR